MITRVYRYGLLPPTEGAERVAEQISLGHRYYNTLVEIERRRRERYAALLTRHVAPELEAEVARLEAEVLAGVAAIRGERQETRRRSEAPEARAAVRDLRARLKEARATLRAAKSKLREDASIQEEIAALNAEANTEGKAARAACGCYWGTYLLAEQALDMARRSVTPPAFRRWDGGGAVAVQLQGGLGWEEAQGGDDTRLRVDMTPRPCGAGKPRPRVRLRVGSEGRAPLWAEWPLILHRPVPEGASITWAAVHRERIAGRDRWSLHLTLRLPDVERADRPGVIALDLGWRRREAGLRVGYLVDDTGGEREILLDPGVGRGLRQVADLRSIRDQRLDALRPALAAWLREQEAAPDWIREATATLHQWRSPARFAALAIRWRDLRWDGDAEGFAMLEAWRKKDKHLWTWETNLRDKVLRWRREQYRVLGAELAGRHGTLVVERFDLRRVQRHERTDSDATENETARGDRTLAAPSDLRACLVAAFASRGGTVVEVDAVNSTRACATCGTVEEWDQALSVTHLCGGCGATWDQDANACRNLLLRHREQVGAGDDPETARIDGAGGARLPKWTRRGRHAASRSTTASEDGTITGDGT